MKAYERKYPSFSLCGLNCSLCPKFHTDGASKCPGCGGRDFHLKHPTCSVISCSQRHDNVEFCFQCRSFPCKKYAAPSDKDSFITYKNALNDLAAAKKDLKTYLRDLSRKHSHLTFLIRHHNDGRSKAFFCTAVNLLPLPILEKIMQSDIAMNISSDRKKSNEMTALIKSAAQQAGIEIVLRK